MNSNQPILVKTPTVLAKTITLSKESCALGGDAVTEIVLVTAGDVYALVGGISYTLSLGEIVLVPNMPYDVTCSGNVEASIILLRLAGFQYSGMDENIWPFLKSEAVFANGAACEQIATTIRQIDAELTDRKFGYEQSATRLAEYLLILLQRNFTKSAEAEGEGNLLLSNVKEYIDKNYEKNITLASLAEIFFVSPFHIAHLFKREYDISPIQYLIHTRIKTASELLAQTQHTVFEISNMVGYANVNYFYILFKRFTGVSPGKYRKQMQK